MLMFPYPTLNIPNVLTILRMLLVPVFVLLVLNEYYDAALYVFIIAGVTDALDGFIARRFDMRSEFGSVMDPIADKLLMVSAFLLLGMKHWVPLFLVPLVILRDVVLLTGSIMIKSAGRDFEVIPSVLGKLTTFFQIATVVYALVLAGEEGPYFMALVYAAAALTLASGMHYSIREIRKQRNNYYKEGE